MRPIPATRLGDSHGLLRAIESRGRVRADEFVTEFDLDDLFPPGLDNALGRMRHFLSYARASGLVKEDRGIVELTDIGRRYVRAGDDAAPYDVSPQQAEWLRRQLREKHMTDSIFHGLAIGLSLLASIPPRTNIATLDFGRSMAYLGRAGWDNENTLVIQGERHVTLLRDMELVDENRRLTRTGDQVRGELTLPVHMSLVDIAAQLNPGGVDAVRAAALAEFGSGEPEPPAPPPVAEAAPREPDADDDNGYQTAVGLGAWKPATAPEERPGAGPPVVPRPPSEPVAEQPDSPTVITPGAEPPAQAPPQSTPSPAAPPRPAGEAPAGPPPVAPGGEPLVSPAPVTPGAEPSVPAGPPAASWAPLVTPLREPSVSSAPPVAPAGEPSVSSGPPESPAPAVAPGPPGLPGGERPPAARVAPEPLGGGGFVGAASIRQAAEEAGLRLPVAVYANVAAALGARKHVLLCGAPGSAKTTLALAVARAAAQAGRAQGATLMMAHADVAGPLVDAARRGKWVVLDELDRADPERALGALSTLLGGLPVALPDGEELAPSADWRLVATWGGEPPHGWAILRRFAVVDVAGPRADVLRGALRAAAGDDPVAAAAAERLVALAEVAPLGAGVFLDAARHAAARNAAAPADEATLALEAFAAYVAPLLGDLDEAAAGRVAEVLRGLTP